MQNVWSLESRPSVVGDVEGTGMWGTTLCSESDQGCSWGLKQDVIKYLKDKGKPERENALTQGICEEMARGAEG